MIRVSALTASRRGRIAPAGDGTSMLSALDTLLEERRQGFAFPEWLEIKFDQDAGPQQSRAMLRALPMLIVIYNAFLAADYFVLPDTFRLSLFLHLAVVTPGVLIAAWLLRGNPNRLERDILGAAPSILIIGQIIAVYAVSTAPDSAHYLYFIVITAICSNTSLPISHRSASWVSWISCGLMAATLLDPRHTSISVAGMQIMTFVVAGFVTLSSNYHRNCHIRRAYLIELRNRLRVETVGKEARHDALTGLANRRRLDEAAGEVWSRGDAEVSPVSIILFDVDRFKAFNDIYGHQAGDACLRRIAGAAPIEAGGADDVAARYGGEEFMVLLPRATLEEARAAAERMRRAIVKLSISHTGSEMGVATASFGVATADVSACSFEALTQAADAALYTAKHMGRNRVSCATLLEPAPRSDAA